VIEVADTDSLGLTNINDNVNELDMPFEVAPVIVIEYVPALLQSLVYTYNSPPVVPSDIQVNATPLGNEEVL
jgi:hypothetical protein